MELDPRQLIHDETTLSELYGPALERSVRKEIDHLDDLCRAFIAASPLIVIGTHNGGAEDTSPRGDAPGFVKVIDDHTLLIPDRRGNNRIDSLRNIVSDPRVALLFLIPGVGETIRVIGHASISTDPALTEGFIVNGKTPRTVIVVAVERVFYQCAKAIVRSKLWDPTMHVDRNSLPSAGTILAEISGGKIGGPEHDRGQPQRIKETLY